MAEKKRVEIYKYILAAIMLPPLLAIETTMELCEFGEDMSLLMTGGKYGGKGSLYRGKNKDRDDYLSKCWNWLFPPNVDPVKFNIAINRLQRHKLLKKQVTSQGVAEIVLTETGKNKAFKTFPLFKLANKQWKGWWLVVTFDIPESSRKTRDLIRNQLVSLGFAQWQKSVYVSPHDIADELNKTIKEYGLEKVVVPMIAKKILSGNDWEFANKIFRIDDISEEYAKIIAGLKKFNGSPNKFRQIFADYLSVLTHDPFLPIGLVPKEGYGRESAFREIRNTASKFKLKIC